MEAQDLAKDVFGSLMLAFLIGFPRTLKEESLTEGSGECLNIIVALKHPDVIEFLFLFHDLSLEYLGKSLNLMRLLHIDQISHGYEIEHVSFCQFLKS